MASSASPQTSRSVSWPISSARRSRTIGWSSTRKTRFFAGSLALGLALSGGGALGRGFLLGTVFGIGCHFLTIRDFFRFPRSQEDAADDGGAARFAGGHFQAAAYQAGAVLHGLESDALAIAGGATQADAVVGDRQA